MKTFRILTIALMFITGNAIAQQGHWCGMNEYSDRLDSEHAGYSLRVEEAREQMLRQLTADPSIGDYRGGVRTIPVVFHVVWNTAAQNISDAAIQAQLNRLNADFAISYLNTQVSQFQAVATNTLIQFCLASTDPQGNPTTGITRTQTSVTGFAIGHDMKSNATGGTDPWPFHSYYNVWVCDIGYSTGVGGVAGFSSFPSWGPEFEAVDGVVLAYQLVGGDQTTLTHETGHYLGLLHTWGVSLSCSEDDGFTDTPYSDEPSEGCPLSKAKCGSLDNVENFMDYSWCATMFTQQQSAYMNNILSTNYISSGPNAQAGRASLVTSNGCEGQQAPVANFVGNPATVGVGVNVSFTDFSFHAPTSWSWTFGDGGTSTQQNPTHAYAATGQYTVSLTATNAYGSDTETKVNYITVTDNGGNTDCDTLMYTDSESVQVLNQADSDAFELDWIDADGEEVHPEMVTYGYDSNWMNVPDENGNYVFTATSHHVDPTVPADNWLTFGPVTIPAEGADLSWKHLFGDMSQRDGYRVLVNLTGIDLADFNGAPVLFNLPDNDPSTAGDSEWATRSVNLPAVTYAGQQVYIGFHHNAHGMVAIFLDDIMMYGCHTLTVGVEEMQDALLTVYPNPSSDNFTVRLESAGRSPVRMTLYDAVGRQVWAGSVQTGGTVTTVIDTYGLPAGVYSLTVVGADLNLSRKLVLSR